MARRVRNLLKWVIFVPRRHRHPVWPGLGVVLFVALLNAACQRWGAYERFEWADLDRLFQSAPSHVKSDIVLVTIGDDDYADASLFNRRSPLAASQVVRLLTAACQLEPTAVGLDLLTSDWTAEERRDAQAKLPPTCRIVWVRDAEPIDAEAHGLRLGGVAGPGGPWEIRGERMCTALPVFEPDDDGIVRMYRTHILARTSNDSDSQALPYATLAWALATPGSQPLRCEFDDASESRAEGEERDRKIRFVWSESFPHIAAGVLLAAAEHPEARLFQSLKGTLDPGPGRTARKTVIIGGVYRQARDLYPTPVGPIYGVELLAQAIETARSTRPIATASSIQSLALEVVVGAVLVVFVTFLRLRLPWAIIVSTMLSVCAAFVICYSFFHYLGYFFAVFGLLVGVVMGAALDATWEPLKNDFVAWWAEFKIRANAL